MTQNEINSLQMQFFQDAQELLAEAETITLQLEEKGEDPEQVNSLFRLIHTLKGNSGMVGEDAINSLCHALESQLDEVRKGKAPLDERILNNTLAVIDILSSASGENSSAPFLDPIRAMTERLNRENPLADITKPEDESAETSENFDSAGSAETSGLSGDAGFTGAGKYAASGVSAGAEASSGNEELSSESFLNDWGLFLKNFFLIEEKTELLKNGGDDADEILMDCGMAAIEIRSSVPSRMKDLNRLSIYLEKLLSLLVRENVSYDPLDFELYHLLLEDMRSEIEMAIDRTRAIQKQVIRNISDIAGVAEMLKNENHIIAVRLDMSDDVFLKEPEGFAGLFSLEQLGGGRLIFLRTLSSRKLSKAFALLEGTLEDFPRFHESLYEGLKTIVE